MPVAKVKVKVKKKALKQKAKKKKQDDELPLRQLKFCLYVLQGEKKYRAGVLSRRVPTGAA